MRLIARWREGVVRRAGDAESFLTLRVVGFEIRVLDGPVVADAEPRVGLEIALVEPHHHPLPVKRRAADALHAGGVERVEPLAGRAVGVTLAAHLPHRQPVVGRADRPLHAVEPRVEVELPAGFENDHLVAAVGQPLGDQRAGRPRADHTDVGTRRGRPVAVGAHDCGPRW